MKALAGYIVSGRWQAVLVAAGHEAALFVQNLDETAITGLCLAQGLPDQRHGHGLPGFYPAG